MINKKSFIFIFLSILSSLLNAEFLYKTKSPIPFSNSESSYNGTLIAEILSPHDGSQISLNSTKIGGYVFNNRDFWTAFGLIGSHGDLHQPLTAIFDAGENRVWSASSAIRYVSEASASAGYPYLGQAHWFMSRDNSNWFLVGESSNNNNPMPEETISFSDTKLRYLKVVHDTQPLNGYSLSNNNYKNFDLKIYEGQATNTVYLPTTQYLSNPTNIDFTSVSTIDLSAYDQTAQIGKEVYAAGENFSLTLNIESLDDIQDFGTIMIQAYSENNAKLAFIWDWASYPPYRTERCHSPSYNYVNSAAPTTGAKKTVTISREEGVITVNGPLRTCQYNNNNAIKMAVAIHGTSSWNKGKNFKITTN